MKNRPLFPLSVIYVLFQNRIWKRRLLIFYSKNKASFLFLNSRLRPTLCCSRHVARHVKTRLHYFFLCRDMSFSCRDVSLIMSKPKKHQNKKKYDMFQNEKVHFSFWNDYSRTFFSCGAFLPKNDFLILFLIFGCLFIV